MRVLLVEDDRSLGAAVARYLREQNCVVDVATNGEDGQHLGATELYDVAVLDLGLPKVDGLSVLGAWRKQQRRMPVLILTARDVWTDKIQGFKAGADDYSDQAVPRRGAPDAAARAGAACGRACGDAGRLRADQLRRPARALRAGRAADEADRARVAGARGADPTSRPAAARCGSSPPRRAPR